MNKLTQGLIIFVFTSVLSLVLGYESKLIITDLNDSNETNMTKNGLSQDDKTVQTRGNTKISENNYIKVQISYATNRQRTKSGNVNKYFNEKLGTLQYGQCIVSIPQTHSIGEMERPWWFLSEDPNKHIMIHEILEQSKNTFFKQMRQTLSLSDEDDILIFIHGYANSFADSMRRTAQMAHDLEFQGIPIAYSWPASNSGVPLFIKYRKDEKKAKKSVAHLKQFLEDVVNNAKGHKINIIAHSMGNRVLAKAISEIERKSNAIFNQIILAAPDIDADVFKDYIFDKLTGKVENVTLYASSDDKALIASKIIHNGPRLGEAEESLVVLKGMDTIDASGIDMGMLGLGHSYFSQVGDIIDDISKIISFGVRPNQRDLLSQTKDQVMYWKIK